MKIKIKRRTLTRRGIPNIVDRSKKTAITSVRDTGQSPKPS